MPPENPEQARWFSTNVLPHETALRAWLYKRFPAADNIDDIIQDVYLRMLRAHESEPIRSPKAFLFRAARNLSIDHLKSHKISRRVSYEEEMASNVVDIATAIPETVSRNQELEILKDAIQSLPTRCRQVVTLHDIYGLAQTEIAKKLGIAPSTVSEQLAIGLSKCTAYMKKYRNERR